MTTFRLSIAYAGLVALVRERSGAQGQNIVALLPEQPNHYPRLRLPKQFLPEDGNSWIWEYVRTNGITGPDVPVDISGSHVTVASPLPRVEAARGDTPARSRFLPRNYDDAAHPGWVASMGQLHAGYERIDGLRALLSRGVVTAHSTLPHQALQTLRLAEVKSERDPTKTRVYSYNFRSRSNRGSTARRAVANVVESATQLRGDFLRLQIEKDDGDHQVLLQPDAGRIDIAVTNSPPNGIDGTESIRHFSRYYDLCSTPLGQGQRMIPRRVELDEFSGFQPISDHYYADPCESILEVVGICDRIVCPVLIMEPF